MRKWEDLVDTYLHKGLRKKLVEILKEKGITDLKVLEAIHAIPRHYFLDSAFDKIAYEDRAFPIAADQTISQPYTVAYQTQLLQIKNSSGRPAAPRENANRLGSCTQCVWELPIAPRGASRLPPS